MREGTPKYPVAAFRPGRCSALYSFPSHASINWRLEDDNSSRPIIKKSRSSRIPRLPAEIIAEIMGHVSDEETLKTCARTAKIFSYQAYKNLYEVVPLCFPNRRTAWDKTPHQFLRLLRESPQIANLVRGLVVHIGIDHANNEPNPLYEIYDDQGRQNLQKVVALLINLRSLSFPRFGKHYRNHASKKTNTPFFPLLSEVQERNLTELDISALTDEQFPSLDRLVALTNVRNLTTDMAFQGTNLASSRYWTPPLRRFALFGQFDIALSVALLAAPLFPLKLEYDNIKVFEIEQRDQFKIYVEDPKRPRNLTFLNTLIGPFRNLKEFRFGPCSCTEYSMKTYERLTDYHVLAAPPDISTLSLKTIVLEGVVECIAYRQAESHTLERQLAACPTAWMVELFQKVSRKSTVREVELRFQVVFQWDCCNSLLAVLFSLWSDLADVLLSWRFPHLRKVKITVDMLDVFRADLTPFRQIDNHPGLKRLKDTGLLVLEI